MLQRLWELFLSAAIIFAFVMWFWLLITVMADLFRRQDTGGFAKVIWVILLVIAPFIGVFLYLISQSRGMAERSSAQTARAREELRQFVGYSPADELDKLGQLKASGAITAEEYARLRAKVLE